MASVSSGDVMGMTAMIALMFGLVSLAAIVVLGQVLHRVMDAAAEFARHQQELIAALNGVRVVRKRPEETSVFNVSEGDGDGIRQAMTDALHDAPPPHKTDDEAAEELAATLGNSDWEPLVDRRPTGPRRPAADDV